MKFIDNIVNKFGADKVMHFLGGALLTAFFAFFGFYPAIAGVIVTAVVSFVKEAFFDEKFDASDMYAALLGSVIVFVFYLLPYFVIWNKFI